MIEIRPATLADVLAVLFQGPLRDNEMAPQACRQYWMASLESWAGCVDGNAACVWGLISPSMMSDSAYLWLVTSDLVDHHRFTFVRQSQMIIERLLVDFPIINGHAMVGDVRAKRWLKWLGVTFEEPIRGLDGKIVLVPFTLRRTLRG